MKSIIEIDDLQVHFQISSGLWQRRTMSLRAVAGVSLNLEPSKVLGIVGESGCGKSTLARAIMGLAKIHSGSIKILGKRISDLSSQESRSHRQHYQMVFQDPTDSINPRMSCLNIIAEPLRTFFPEISQSEITEKVVGLMAEVGLDESMANRYPHEFSGGQRQRISIARALSISPQLLICDEAVSALDVSIQAQILNLFCDIRDQRKLAMIFISHDLSVVRHISDTIAVMYLGKIVEIGESHQLISNPKHPYTQSLIDAVPNFRRKTLAKVLEGDIPSPIDLPPGCSFSSRCPHAFDLCHKVEPLLQELDTSPSTRKVACHLKLNS